MQSKNNQPTQPTQNNKNKNTCTLCHQEFANEIEFRAHSTMCNIQYETGRERKRITAKHSSEPIPIITWNQMVERMQLLEKQNEQLKNRVEKLERATHTKQKKINIQEYLTKHVEPPYSWSKWVSLHFVLKADDVEEFGYGHLTAKELVERVIKDGLINDDTNTIPMPIYSFSHKMNEIFVYAKAKEKHEQPDNQDEKKPQPPQLEWRKFETKDMTRLLQYIERMICLTCNQWKTANEHLLTQKQINTVEYNLANIPTAETNTCFPKFFHMIYQNTKHEYTSMIEMVM